MMNVYKVTSWRGTYNPTAKHFEEIIEAEDILAVIESPGMQLDLIDGNVQITGIRLIGPVCMHIAPRQKKESDTESIA